MTSKKNSAPPFSEQLPWEEAFKLSRINHRAPYLRFFTWAFNIEIKKIAEIGVNKGETSQLLRHLYPEAHLYLIDPWEYTPNYIQSTTPISLKKEHYAKAYKTVCESFHNDPKTTILKMTSLEAISHTPEQLDLVFIDANHAYESVKENILAWLPKIRPGGILAGHDYTTEIPPFAGVKQAVDEIFGNEVTLGKDRVWIHIC